MVMRVRQSLAEEIVIALKTGQFDNMTCREIAAHLKVSRRSVVRAARTIGDGLPNRNYHIGERKSRLTSIYFVQEGSKGPIKIGVSAEVACRFSSIQVGNPRRLRLLGTAPCYGKQLEIEIHRKFSHLRIRGEWFRPAPELLDFITKCLNVPEKQLA